MSKFLRSYPLDDISIRSDGTGRTVEAYAAVFNVAADIHDREGVYREQIAPNAFAKTIAERGTRFGVFYNHARTLSGSPSDLFSVPLGSPIEVRADGRGLLTVTRYNKTPLADQILEAVSNGDITGQSFSGRFVQSDKKAPPGGHRRGRDGSLTLVTRSEIAMDEYGPTPFPAYAAAEILGVRSGDLLAQLREMDDDERDAMRAEFAALLNLPVARLDDAAIGTGTSSEAVADEPQAHSGRSHPSEAAELAAAIRERKLP